jgi:hypothetical protein
MAFVHDMYQSCIKQHLTRPVFVQVSVLPCMQRWVSRSPVHFATTMVATRCRSDWSAPGFRHEAVNAQNQASPATRTVPTVVTTAASTIKPLPVMPAALGRQQQHHGQQGEFKSGVGVLEGLRGMNIIAAMVR